MEQQQKQYSHIKVILNLIQDLQRPPLLLLNNLRGRFQIKFGMTSLFNNGTLTTHGFTLIELLVVVLIIGILAAVALPQYNKAVKKARGIEALAAIDTYDKAQAAYYLEHGNYAGITANTLTVQMPELKNWEYLSSGTKSHNFQMGCSAPSGNETWLYLNLDNTDDGLTVTWKNGKLESKRTFNSRVEPYFKTTRNVAWWDLD